jgi:hypothetical protein
MNTKEAKHVHASSNSAERRIELRIDPPTDHRALEGDPLIWSLHEELAREMSSQLSVISSCLGTCHLLTADHRGHHADHKLQAAIAMANEAILRASEINRSSRCLSRLQSNPGRAYTVKHSVDQALRILHPKLHGHGILIDLQHQQAARAAPQSPELPQVLVVLIDSLIERLCHHRGVNGVLSITTSARRNQVEILLSCGSRSQTALEAEPAQCDAARPTPTHQPAENAPPGDALAREASKRLGCNVRFGTTRLGDHAYSILFETEHGLQRQEGQI